MKARWSQHKRDIGKGSNWKAFGLTRHFGTHHVGDMEVAIHNMNMNRWTTGWEILEEIIKTIER